MRCCVPASTPDSQCVSVTEKKIYPILSCRMLMHISVFCFFSTGGSSQTAILSCSLHIRFWYRPHYILTHANTSKLQDAFSRSNTILQNLPRSLALIACNGHCPSAILPKIPLVKPYSRLILTGCMFSFYVPKISFAE